MIVVNMLQQQEEEKQGEQGAHDDAHQEIQRVEGHVEPDWEPLRVVKTVDADNVQQRGTDRSDEAGQKQLSSGGEGHFPFKAVIPDKDDRDDKQGEVLCNQRPADQGKTLLLTVYGGELIRKNIIFERNQPNYNTRHKKCNSKI